MLIILITSLLLIIYLLFKIYKMGMNLLQKDKMIKNLQNKINKDDPILQKFLDIERKMDYDLSVQKQKLL